MSEVPVRTRDFFDRYVTKLIISKYGFSEKEAINSFINSETYSMFLDYDLEIYKMSPLIVFDMWESERITGDPRNSQYIRNQYL